MKISLLFPLFCLACPGLSAAGQTPSKTAINTRPPLSAQKAASGNFRAIMAAARKNQAKTDTPAAPPPVPVFCILGGHSGKPFGDLAAFKSVIWKSDAIYAGEDPGPGTDRQALLEILKAMREARGSKIAVGFEALDMTLQPVLDDYAAGKMSEEDFLQKTGWPKDPGADFALYRPVFDFIIRNKLRALALNVPKELILKIEREGPASLTDKDKRQFIPAQINIGKQKKYLELLKTSFKGTEAPDSAGPAWDNYLAAVSYRNEGEGAKIADFINANRGWSVLVSAGNDRLIYNAAVPASVKSRTVKIRQASFYAKAAAKCPDVLPAEDKDLANYIWYTTTTVISGQ